MKKYDESLVEVWEWKDKILKDTGGLSSEKYIDMIAKEAERVLEEQEIKLPVRRLNEAHKRVA